MTESDKINVVIAMNFSEAILERIRDISPRLQIHAHYPEIPSSVWRNAEILYTSHHFPEPDDAPMLRWVQLHTAGADRALKHRIIQLPDMVVTTSSGVHVKQMANYCLMAILAFHYKVPRMFHDQQQRHWPENRYIIYNPLPLSSLTVGIAGYGSIGREVARLASMLDMKVIASKRDAKRPAESPYGYTPEGTGDPDGDIPERIYPNEAIVTMVRECDYVVVTLPATAKTRHVINETVLNAMKESAILINVARGEVVDEKALITALSQGKLGGAALDVFEEEPLPSGSPLWQMDNVLISPHVTGNSTTYNDMTAELFMLNLKRYLDKKPLLNPLDRELGY